jgi:hypothetical protein
VASGVTERRRTTHIFYEKRVPEDQLVKPLWFDDDVGRCAHDLLGQPAG